MLTKLGLKELTKLFETDFTETVRPAIDHLRANPNPASIHAEPVMKARQHLAAIHSMGLDELMDFEQEMEQQFRKLFWPLFHKHASDYSLNEEMPCGCLPKSR